MSLLEVKNLHVSFGKARAVCGISFSINEGETFALVGESGCGKTTAALAIAGLLPRHSAKVIADKIVLKEKSLLRPPDELRHIRGKEIGFIFQEPMSSLNPVFTVGWQLAEVFKAHGITNPDEIYKRSIELLSLTGLSQPEARLKQYPHELSGGMKQRVMIAMALALKPDLLISDEPTTALDVTIQWQILSLIRQIQKKQNLAQLLITHDLGVVAEFADRVAVMYAGQIVETASTKEILSRPVHPYTQALLAALPKKNRKKLYSISGRVPSPTDYPAYCHFFQRCFAAKQGVCDKAIPTLKPVKEGFTHQVACFLAGEFSPLSIPAYSIPAVKKDQPIALNVQNLGVHYPIRKGVFKRIVGYVKAVHGVSFTVKQAETFALVGESGCGKTSLGKALVGLNPIRYGNVFVNGVPLSRETKIQMVFQDPYSSLNPRMMIGQALEEPLKITKPNLSAAEYELQAKKLLETVGLEPMAYSKYPHEFSGGQRQRITIARALAANPEFIVCDEATSALDVSVQAQIINLLRDLQDKFSLTYLFITHNLPLVESFADSVAVMYLGKIMEIGSAAEIFENPLHPYTKALFSAALSTDTSSPKERIRLQGEIPSAANPPTGCVFHTRCPIAKAECALRQMPLREVNGRKIACDFV
ncbi:MAG: ABC transporter ATP-binding protein [Candidatus Hydrogenedentota bacterium]|nr:MAG: ABC transporter ATP-binding protein [Candidatus Hydrogenedentota bacterium]